MTDFKKKKFRVVRTEGGASEFFQGITGSALYSMVRQRFGQAQADGLQLKLERNDNVTMVLKNSLDQEAHFAILWED